MTGRIRSHRRFAGALNTAAALGFMMAFCCGLSAIKVAAQLPWLDADHPRWWNVAEVGLGGAWIAYGIGRAVRRSRHRARAREQMTDWVATSGWTGTATDGAWPWTSLQRWPDIVTVLNAYANTVDGFPVTIGEITWTENGLGNAVDRYAGRGLFVLVRLTQSVPSMGVRAYRTLARPRRGEDEFRRRFQTVGFDSHRLDDAALRAAHVRGDVPPWTVIDRELFAFVPLDGPVTPAVIDSAIRGTLLIVRLMDLGPDGVAPDSAGAGRPDVPDDETPPGYADELPGQARRM